MVQQQYCRRLLTAALEAWKASGSTWFPACHGGFQCRLSATSTASSQSPLAAAGSCLYYAALRPSEAVALRDADCVLPDAGWGRIDLSASEPRAGPGDRAFRTARGGPVQDTGYGELWQHTRATVLT